MDRPKSTSSISVGLVPCRASAVRRTYERTGDASLEQHRLHTGWTDLAKQICACEDGATEIVVAGAHDGMLNLIWEQLDPHAELTRGYENRRNGKVAGIDQLCDAVFFVGYPRPGGGRPWRAQPPLQRA